MFLTTQQVLQRYYTQYLCGYDAIALNQLIQELQNLPEEESVILSSMCNEIGNLSVKQGMCGIYAACNTVLVLTVYRDEVDSSYMWMPRMHSS